MEGSKESFKLPVQYDGILSDDTPVVSNRNTYLAAFTAFLYMFAMGLTISYTASASVDMKRPGSRMMDVTDDEITWIGSLTLLGGLPANFIGGYLSHTYGRKSILILTSPLFLISWLMITYATTIEWICAGRIISGFCTGLYIVASPAYVTEIAPQEIRGKLSSGLPFFNNFGILVSLCLGIGLRWSWLALSIAFVITISMCMMVFMPESPAWLVRESRIAEAASGLRFLRGKKADVKMEIQQIVESLRTQEQSRKISLQDLKNPTLYKPMALTVMLMLFHQTPGTGPLMSYTVEIFHNAGTTIDPQIAAIVYAVTQIAASLLCGSIIDKYGRRKLYIISGIGTTLILLINGAHSLVITMHPEVRDKVGFLPLITFPAFSFIFTVGLGSIPFVMIPEMVSVKYRSSILSLATFALSVFGFAFTKSFDSVRSSFGDYGLYWTYAFLTFFSIPFGYFLLPETRNMSIDEIAQSFSKSFK